MKQIISVFALAFFSASSFGSYFECQPEDSNYSIGVSLEAEAGVDFLRDSTFTANLYAEVNDDPGFVAHQDIRFWRQGDMLVGIARGQDELTQAKTLFAMAVNVALSDMGLYYGAAVLESNIEGGRLFTMTDEQIISHVKENINQEGLISCEVKTY